MVTNLFLPEELIVAAHVMSRKNAELAKEWLSLQDVNDASNGVLWCRAIEEAWGRNQICFVTNPGE